MSLETDVVALAASTNSLLEKITVGKATLNAAAATSTAQATTAVSLVNAAAEKAATAKAQASAAAGSAALASSVVQQDMTAISKSIHSGTIVKAIIYDTSKDSDGGAWRKRCEAKSWYTETIYGIWGGQAANVAAGWAACGSVIGGYYQNTTDGKYYTPTSVSTQTEVFRGNVREFPAVVAIVAETTRVVIYDLTQTGTPMFAVCPTGILSSISSIAATNGKVCIGSSNGSSGYMVVFDFLAAVPWWSIRALGKTIFTGTTFSSIGTGALNAAPAIVNATVNDIAITVLDTAPIDPATGLPVPTIAVATAGGVSVIKDDGTVVSSAYTGALEKLKLRRDSSLFAGGAGTGGLYFARGLGSLGASFAMSLYHSASLPAVLRSVGGTIALKVANTSIMLAELAQLSIIKENPAIPAKGMVSYITNAYNSGWMPGDIRGAYLADSVVETVIATDLVTGDSANFTGGTVGGWVQGISSSRAVVSGEMQVTQTAINGRSVLPMTFAVGKSYQITADIRRVSGTGASATLFISNASDGGNTAIALALTTSATAVTVTGWFYAAPINRWSQVNNTQYYLAIGSNGGVEDVYGIDNVSVKLAEPDRSVKNKGLTLVGTLTKTAVASGASLVAYSGFSASNYLEQPYNSDLDFGTGDFCVMGWVNLSYIGSSFTSALFSRALLGSTGGLYAVVGITGNVVLYGSASTSFVSLLATTAVLTTGVWNLVCVRRLSGVLYIDFNGINVSSVADTTNLTYASTALRLGLRSDATNWVQGSLALWRISATAPSADQIAHIYRTELPLFQPNAQCCIAGTSTAVTALAYDEDTDLLHVGTSWGRSGFKNLLRVDSEATTTGALTSLSASGGTVLTSGTSGKVYKPAYNLRDYSLKRDDLNDILVYDYLGGFTATTSITAGVSNTLTAVASSLYPTSYVGAVVTGSGIPASTAVTYVNGTTIYIDKLATIAASNVQISFTDFNLPSGYKAITVLVDGVMKYEGATRDFTRLSDGFKEIIRFGVAPAYSAKVQIQSVRTSS